VFSPDGDGQNDAVAVHYALDEAARPVMLVDGRRVLRGKSRSAGGRLVWRGTNGRRGVRPGRYEIRLRATDRAGNRGSTPRVVPVLVRYVSLSRERIEVEAGRRFRLRVSKDAPSYRWLFAGQVGVGRTSVLRLRAPDEPGEYKVVAVVGSHADSARVIVTAPAPVAEP
jgi:hypothetical protein